MDRRLIVWATATMISFTGAFSAGAQQEPVVKEYRQEVGWLPFLGIALVKGAPVYIFQVRDFGQGALPEWRLARAKCPLPLIRGGLVYLYFKEDHTYVHTNGMHAHYMACTAEDIPLELRR